MNREGLGFSGWGVPVYCGIDFGVHEDISAGVQLSYRSYRHKTFNHSIFGATANGNYHFNRILKIPQTWDLYAGLNLGIYVWSSPSEYDGSDDSSVSIGIQFGGRYYFNSQYSINLEFGGGVSTSNGKIGVSYSF